MARHPVSARAAAATALARRWALDSPLVAAGCVLGGVLLFATQDMLSKVLVVDYSPLEIAWVRYGINTILILPFMVRHHGRALRTRVPLLQGARSLAVLTSAVIFMAGLGYLPQADATSISFLSPLLVTALSIPLLGEKVGIRRWTAVAIGFVGMLVIVRPGSSAFQLPALLPIASASFWALALVLTRRLGVSEAGLTTLTYSTVLPAVILTLLLPFFWRTPDARAVILMLAIGVVSVLAQYLTILGYSKRPASSLAPLTFTQLVWATMYGYLVFDAIPGPWTWLGAAIIVASGLYTFRRERIVRARRTG